ncbi:MAG TPA: penicillin acylase family protein [Xanthomonadaceae bacterium]|nr:penicillin acylase family protein [Xanthomonadaceae bacterium]
MPVWSKRAALVLLLLVLAAGLAGWWLVRASVPRLDGDQAVPGLRAAASVRRDALGAVTIDAASEADAMRALGWVHAQERFFEMDLMRRTAAGELAELFGPAALELDRQHRAHRLRARAAADFAAFAGDDRDALQAYVDGVNAGLGALRARPWPYLLLRALPRAWAQADSALVGDAMYFDLQEAGTQNQRKLMKLRGASPPALYALLARDGTAWDAPLLGSARGEAVLQGAAALDLRRLPQPAHARALALREAPARDIGSNNFAVAGPLTRDGRAILADDMHLGLRAPNIWFRVRLRYPDAGAPGGRVDVVGLSLPGLPGVIVGSNGHVAWGFTNSYVETSGWRVVHPCARAGQTACTPVHATRETIRVAGAAPATLDVEDTDWGPILDHAGDGSPLALRWAAQLPGALNLGIGAFARAGDVRALLAAADRTAIPTQNLVAVDSAGHVAWRWLGPLPVRAAGCAPRAARLQAAATRTEGTAASCPPWSLATDQAPALVDPPSGRLWTANARVVDGGLLARAGDGGYALGARAKQIRDDLFARRRFAERDLLAIQLDDRALFLQRWWRLLQGEAATARTPALQALARASRRWDGRASPDSVSYRIARAWRLAVHARLLDGLTAPAQAALGDGFEMPDLPQFEGVAWPLVTRRPSNLLPRRYSCESLAKAARTSMCGDPNGWDALFEDAAAQVRDDLARDGPLAGRSWGERNTARICHPLARALPAFVKPLLCMPADALAGDSNMPRVTAPDFGASERLVVAPGHEADGILHMPGGQSGHPLSPYWGAGHEDWVHGRATPLLPGPAQHTLRLLPSR